MELVPIVSVLSIFVFAPAIVFSFVYFSKRNKFKLEELRYKKEMLELEIEKERVHIRSLEVESAKYDRLIEGHGKE